MFRYLFFSALILIISQPYVMGQVNYDENKIETYELPELLVDGFGNQINNSNDWERMRRPQLLKKFERNIYGKFPNENLQVSFKLRSVHSLPTINAIQKNIDIIFSNGTNTVVVDLVVFLPSNVEEATPVFVGLNFFGNHTIHSSPYISVTASWTMNKPEFDIQNNRVTESSRGVRSSRWPVERIINRGYGLAVMYYGDIDPDFDDGFKNGIHALLTDSQKQIEEGISSISAWAFGLSKAMDYFEIDKDIDNERVAVIGHSRLGKSSLWAGAHDDRFAMVISNNSGCGGAALSRRRIGETVKIINTSFPHWFSKNYKYANGKELEQDIDQHMLLALIAPRPVYVASAKEDAWADPVGEFLSLNHTGPVYALYGQTIFDEKIIPNLNEPIIKDKMAYHIRSGKHDLTRYDWERYLDFADIHFKK